MTHNIVNDAIAEADRRIKMQQHIDKVQPILDRIKADVFDSDLDVAAYKYMVLAKQFADLRDKHD